MFYELIRMIEDTMHVPNSDDPAQCFVNPFFWHNIKAWPLHLRGRPAGLSPLPPFPLINATLSTLQTASELQVVPVVLAFADGQDAVDSRA